MKNADIRETSNAGKPHIGRAAFVSLAAAIALFAGDGRADVELAAGKTRVVVAPDASPVVRFAADEMTNYLSRVLGAPVPIVHEAKAEGEGEQRTVNVVLGENAWSRAAGIDVKGLPRDAFVIDARATEGGGTVYVAGRDDPEVDVWDNLRHRDREMNDMYERATVFGAYDFLERFAGCRFYFPGELGEIVRRRDRLEVPEGRITEIPYCPRRQWYSGGVKGLDGDAWPKLTNGLRYWQGLNLLRQRRSSIWYPGHAMTFLQLQERFGKTHPEYFLAVKQKDGTLRHETNRPFRLVAPCFSSAVTNEIYEDVKAFFTGKRPESRGMKPAVKGVYGVGGTVNGFESVNGWNSCLTDGRTFSLGLDDGSGPDCQCGECEKHYRRDVKDSPGSEFIWGMTAAIGRRLQEEGIPGLLEQYAYTWYRRIPEGLTLPTNIIAVVCCNGPWSRFKPEERAHDLKLVKDWAALTGNRVYLHNWALKYSRLNIPDVPAVGAIATGQYYEDVGPWMQGVMYESQSDHFAHAFLANYIAAKMTWNPRFDWRGALHEHYGLMYGPAADEMERFFTELEDLWLGKMAAGKTGMDARGPVPTVPSVYEMWRGIYTAERLAAWERLLASAASKVPSGSLEARRIALMKRSILDVVLAARRDFEAGSSMEKEEARRAREGVRNVLDREYEADFEIPPKGFTGNWETQAAKAYFRIPFKYDKAKKYRLSYYVNLEDVVPQYGHKFCGALIAVYGGSPYGSWGYSAGASALTGGTAGWVHVSKVYDFSPARCKPDGIVVWLRGATGKMQVKGLILEEVGK